MTCDPSAGYDQNAEAFMAARSDVGTDIIKRWVQAHLPPSAKVLDLGCGSGVPISRTLLDQGCRVFGVDASPRLIATFQQMCPEAQSICEPAETSAFFHRTFDAAVAIGLIFLLPEEAQILLIHRIANALKPGARFLFSAPWQTGEWEDVLTGQISCSLGKAVYQNLLSAAGLAPADCLTDARGNHYYDAIKPADPPR